MDFSDEELNLIEELGSTAMTIPNVAKILQVPELDFELEYSQPMSQARTRYLAGFLRLEAELHKSVKESAMQGSNPAQQLMQRYIDEVKNTQNDG